MFPSLIKANSSDMGIQIISPAAIDYLGDFSLKAMAYDMNQVIYFALPEIEPLTTVGDGIAFYLKMQGKEMDYFGTEITKEEFYRIPDLSHDGAYIQHIDGTLYTGDEWTAKGFNNDEANGIAVINAMNNIHCVVAKDSLGKLTWSSMPDTLIEGVSTITNRNNIDDDYNGVENTAIIAAADLNSAAAACANYTFPNGQKGYLVAYGESFILNNIDTLLELIGGTPLGDVYIWTSTQYDAEKAWYNRINGLNDQNAVSKSDNLEVRPVCALENYKFATN